MKVPMASVKYGADFYKKGYSYKCFVRVICLPVTSHDVLQRHSTHSFDGIAF